LLVLTVVLVTVVAVSWPSEGASDGTPPSLFALKWFPAPEELDQGTSAGMTGAGGVYSVPEIERFSCESSGTPATYVDISCNTTVYGQDFTPDNEIAVVVDPTNPSHIVAGSNDYYYRFNNTTGARQAIVPTGFFTSFDGGATWLDGQVPMRFGNGAGDPSPAFDAKHGVVLMAQLENTGGQSGPWVVAGDVSVSRSTDGGQSWSTPVSVYHGTGAGIGPATNAVFWDKEWLTVDNNPGSPFYGRAYLVATEFVNGLFGSYVESPIFLSYSDDGGLTWSMPKEISGSNATYCTFQTTGPAGECDEDQFGLPAVASDGTLYVHFINGQNEGAWEQAFDFDSQIMVVKSTDGGQTFSDPVPAVQLEDGLSDMPFSVIRRQTVYGHQIRWNAVGSIAVDPRNPDHVTVVFADRGTPNPNAAQGCFLTASGGLNIGTAPNYDPCNAGPGAVLNVYRVDSMDGGATWSRRSKLSASKTHQWFPWAAYKPGTSTLVAAWDEDTTVAPQNDTFQHMLWDGRRKSAVGPLENPDDSVTHWAGQYTTAWPAVCGPVRSSTPGKGCNVFHGDYTGLAVGPDGSIHIVWTGLNAIATSAQIDFYTGTLRTGYRQDAMYARR